VIRSLSSCSNSSRIAVLSGQHPGPLRWAAVEAGKWARVRPGPRNFLDAVSSSVSMGLGATDRSCRLLR
jgi:hypothetical protein